MSELGGEARRLARRQHSGVLSTLSRSPQGYPFGSVSPFILDHAGRPVILVSGLAEHTRNLLADARVSLIVQPFAEDMQQTGRVTLLGNAARLEDKRSVGRRYLRYHPQAQAYLEMADFAFFRIEPLRIRYIGGFGRIHWIEPAAYLVPAGTLVDAEEALLARMNGDHRHDLAACCRQVHGIDTDEAEMIGLDPDGFDVRAAGRRLRFEFATPCADAEAAHDALMACMRRARP